MRYTTLYDENEDLRRSWRAKRSEEHEREREVDGFNYKGEKTNHQMIKHQSNGVGPIHRVPLIDLT